MLSDKAKKALGHIHALAIPAIITGITEPILGLADTAFVGRLGTTSLAAVGLAASFYMLLLWLLTALRGAVSAVVALQTGRGFANDLRQFIPQVLLLALTLGLLAGIATYLYSERILSLYGAKGQLLQEAVAYLRIRAWALPFSLCTLTIFGIFRGMQNTSHAMAISLTGATLNILLDWILIFGVPGIVPALGVTGAAWATLFAQLLVLLLAFNSLRRKTDLHYHLIWRPHPKLYLLYTLSRDLLLRTLALNIAYLMGYRFAAMYGEAALAAYTIGIHIWFFSSFLLDGYASAAAALVGKMKGAGETIALYYTARLIVNTGIVLSLVLAALYLLAYSQIGIFFSNEPEVLQQFHTYFWLIIVCQPLNAIAFILDGVFEGAGDSAFLRNTLFISLIFGFIPAMYTFDAFGLGMLAIWLSYFIWMVLRAGMLWLGSFLRYGRPAFAAALQSSPPQFSYEK